MLFVDQAKIYVKAGKGGDGCGSFRYTRYHRYGIPDGGDGGKGGDVIIQADRSLYTLLDFKYKSSFIAPDGKSGSSNNRKGKDAKDLVIRVPVGTLIIDAKTGCILKDLDKDKDSIVIASGGKGGRGNSSGAKATKGLPGQERELILDLKLIADVGLIGFPNVGKSTLISSISSVSSLVAPYPFTTKKPVLGVVKYNDFSFVVADIPGLISGSHQGRGLGDRFLRHIERTKLILHIIDISGSEGRDPIEDYKIINKELRLYNKALLEKPQILVANKMDLNGSLDNLELFKRKIKRKIYPISALKKEGLEELIEEIVLQLQKIGS
ncbi:MAG: GTPase ObgE [Candidatus Omnitrophica bacterium]|nr:GTPase ObgE [Candidatus Omnitrophota bacterium]MCM8799539.1 GTPase ObgE [Candidatus Omnitrophota bacterium]